MKPIKILSQLTFPLLLITMPLLRFLCTPHRQCYQRLITTGVTLILLLYSLTSYANYDGYSLSINVSDASPEMGKPVVFNAQIEPELDDSQVSYQFLINGQPIAGTSGQKRYSFTKKGTYKISAVATLGNAHLINSSTKIIHVMSQWITPNADITPKTLRLRTGEKAVFRSSSNVDSKSRQWLYWKISSGHRSTGETFRINTSRFREGQYPITLLLRDDRHNESIARAVLIIDNDPTTNPATQNDSQQEAQDTQENQPDNNDDTTATIMQPPRTNTTTTSSLTALSFRASHIHRLSALPIVYWVKNSQIGADTVLQLDTGDGKVTPWSRRLRYTHVYDKLGIYTAELRVKERNSAVVQQRHTLTVYIWPLWLPLGIGGGIILLALYLLFRQRKKAAILKKTSEQEAAHISYQQHPDEGYQQITITEESEQKTASFTVSQQPDTGTQTLKSSNTKKGEQPHGTQPHKDD